MELEGLVSMWSWGARLECGGALGVPCCQAPSHEDIGLTARYRGQVKGAREGGLGLGAGRDMQGFVLHRVLLLTGHSTATPARAQGPCHNPGPDPQLGPPTEPEAGSILGW